MEIQASHLAKCKCVSTLVPCSDGKARGWCHGKTMAETEDTQKGSFGDGKI